MGVVSNEHKMLIIIAVILCALFSMFVSNHTYNTDFPNYYYAASAILDKKAEPLSVHELDCNNKYGIPESRADYLLFPGSLLSAYILSPLALMPYYLAKAVVVFINIINYLVSVAIALRLGGATGRGFVYPLVLSCLWLPFISNLFLGNINAILLCLVSFAVLAATKNQPVLCGTLLGIAALFKLFPLAIAMVLGVKNRRIIAASVIFLGASFLVPGSLEWIRVLGQLNVEFYGPRSQWIKSFGYPGFIAYAVIIAVITALIVHRTKRTNYPLIVSYAIPAMFLTVPTFLYYHLTILMFSYAYLFNNYIIKEKSTFIIIILSVLLICGFGLANHSSTSIVALFLLWLMLSCKLIFKKEERENNSLQID